MKRNLGRAALAALPVLVVASCGGGSGGSHHPGLVSVAVYPVKGTTPQAEQVDPFDPAKAKQVQVTVTGPSVAPAITVTSPFSLHEVAVDSIPFGYGRQIIVEVCAANCDPKVAGDILARGRSVPFDVLEDSESNPPPVPIFVTPRNSFSSPATAAVPPQPTRPVVADRIGATATLLDDGRILLLGGAKVKAGAATWFRAEDLEAVVADAEVHDPRSGQFSAVGPMTRPRAFHQAVKLANGQVVVLGGYTQDPDGAPRLDSSVEVFDPATGTFRASPVGIVPPGGRALFTAALLDAATNTVLIAGGIASPGVAGAYADVYLLDWGPVGHVELGRVRYNHAMVFASGYGLGTLGPEGVPAFVLFGGQNDTGTVAEVEALTVSGYQVALDATAVANLPGGGRTLLSAVFVPQQRIAYVIGGFSDTALGNPSNRVDIYVPNERGFWLNERGQPKVLLLKEARGAMTATLMDFDTILIAGGRGTGGSILNTMELIVEEFVCKDPAKQTGCAVSISRVSGVTPLLDPPRAAHLAVFDATRRVFLAGGFSQPYAPVQDAVFYNPD